MRALCVVHINTGVTGDPHPEPLPPHRVRLDCETIHGVPHCYGAAVYGPERCTCWTLTDDQVEQCVAEAWEAFHARGGRPCDDCAFRAGSPESEDIERIAAQDAPFHCHKGMPVDARGGTPIQDAYCPSPDQNGERFPICAGWRNAHAARCRSVKPAVGGSR